MTKFKDIKDINYMLIYFIYYRIWYLYFSLEEQFYLSLGLKYNSVISL